MIGKLFCLEVKLDSEKLNKILDGMPFVLNERQYNFLVDYISKGRGHAVLNGLAGVGKSLLMYVLHLYYKDEIVFFGTTGVSSQNLPQGIGMGTGHSYLSLATKPTNELNYKKVSRKFTDLFSKTDLVKIIVIDEAYLYNSDNLDLIWRRIERMNKRSSSRKARNVRLLLVGDCCQALTIADDSVREELTSRWGSYLMFESNVWGRFNFDYYVLDHVERQSDKVYKACLDIIRYNNQERLPKCIEWLNKRVNENYSHDSIILAATNKTVDRINNEVLKRNPNKRIHFKPKIKGDFDIKNTLMRKDGVTLAEGLKVMTIFNDPEGENRWINGSIGYINSISTEGCYVTFNHSGEEHFVPIHKWENKEVYAESVTYKDGEKGSELKERVIGTMFCIGLLPASAISISKSQGLTISEDYVIDLESDWLYTSEKLGDFGTNFLYLALSRGTSIQNVTFARPVTLGHVKCHQPSIDFWFKCKDKSII